MEAIQQELQEVIQKEPQGNVSKIFFLKGDKIHGKFHLFHPNGTIFQECYYEEGILEGPSCFYSDSGVLVSKVLYLGGKRQGKGEMYYRDGACYAHLNFKDGEYDKEQQYWYEDGKLKTSLFYALGMLDGSVKLFWPSGQLKRICHFVKGKRHGEDKLWTELGILSDESCYENGAPMGLQKTYYSSGSVKEAYFYHSQSRCDKKTWNTQGIKLFEGVWNEKMEYVEKYFSDQGEFIRERKGFLKDGQLSFL